MEKECGVTKISLQNIDELLKEHCIIKMIFHSCYPVPEEAYTDVFFQDGYVHRATGFGVGYKGEGAKGLSLICQAFLFRNDITLDLISQLKHGSGNCYLFTKGTTNGKKLLIFSGVMDCEFDVDIF